MSVDSPLKRACDRLLREAFGEPNRTLGRDHHWALKPHANGISINVLVNGTLDVPVVWVFDPYDHSTGVVDVAIETEDTVEKIIAQIQERLQRASLVFKHDGHTPGQ
jgi:hypothetical protein